MLGSGTHNKPLGNPGEISKHSGVEIIYKPSDRLSKRGGVKNKGVLKFGEPCGDHTSGMPE